jgi:hypothetical protein
MARLNEYESLLHKTVNVKSMQGDQIERIFALCLIVYLEQFLENFRSSPPTFLGFFFSTIKIMH